MLRTIKKFQVLDKGERRAAEQGKHSEGVSGLHQAAEEGQGEEERGGGEVQEVGAEPQEGAAQDTGAVLFCLLSLDSRRTA